MLLNACATATWQWSKTAPGYVAPSQVFLVVTLGPEFDSDADDGGGIASLVDALTSELNRRGIPVNFAEADERKAYPRLTLTVRASDPGNRVLSHFLPTGNASISVDCEVRRARGQPASFRGEIAGYLMGQSTTDSSTGAEAAGRAIARAVAGGRAD
jgi:hypothetical protein